MGILSIDFNNSYFDKIFMKMILIVLFFSYFWLGILNLEKEKHLKKDKSKINPSSVVS